MRYINSDKMRILPMLTTVKAERILYILEEKRKELEVGVTKLKNGSYSPMNYSNSVLATEIAKILERAEKGEKVAGNLRTLCARKYEALFPEANHEFKLYNDLKLRIREVESELGINEFIANLGNAPRH